MPKHHLRSAVASLILCGVLACGGSAQSGGLGSASGGQSNSGGTGASAGSIASAGATQGGAGATPGGFSGAGNGPFAEPGCEYNGTFYGWGQSVPSPQCGMQCTCGMDE